MLPDCRVHQASKVCPTGRSARSRNSQPLARTPIFSRIDHIFRFFGSLLTHFDRNVLLSKALGHMRSNTEKKRRRDVRMPRAAINAKAACLMRSLARACIWVCVVPCTRPVMAAGPHGGGVAGLKWRGAIRRLVSCLLRHLSGRERWCARDSSQ
jgi:hypothetical protein